MSKVEIKNIENLLKSGSNRQIILVWQLDPLTDYVWEINLSNVSVGFLKPNVVAFCRLYRREDYESDSEYEVDFYEFPSVPDEIYFRTAFLRRLLENHLISQEMAGNENLDL